MAKLIEVEERDLDFIFGRVNPYSLDVYQRDYRWNESDEYKIVSQLLKDIELMFDRNYTKHSNFDELKGIYNEVIQEYKAYFLNTIMLNEQEGKVFIVDGQQRLTTILLMLISLYHIGKNEENNYNLFNIDKLLGEKIFEEDKVGKKDFKISNQDRNTIIQKLFSKEDILDNDIKNISQKNLKDNFQVISKYYNEFFYKNGVFDFKKYNYYFYFITSKVLVIEQIVKHKEDVAMIFETANDRGKELDSHEVLKGMLLGVLGVEDKEECNKIWVEALNNFFEFNKNYKNVDDFFRLYFRAKYANNKNQYQSFAGKYHRNLLSNKRLYDNLDRTKPEKIKKFIEEEFYYFYRLYLKLLDKAYNEKDIYLASNYANEQDQQYLLILSAIKYNDPDEEKKISLVGKKLDQFYTLSRLVGIYDSNKHQEVIYDLNESIRESDLATIESKFDKITVSFFNENNISILQINELIDYKYMSSAKHDGRFTKYLLARIDKYLADILNEQSFAKQESLHFITHSGSKPANGFHIEHMFSNNDLIKNQFLDSEGNVDEIYFNKERNKLGALILLKGNENIRTSNWVYYKKIDSYKNSGFIWNRILTGSINKASLNSCHKNIKEKFKSYAPDANGLLVKESIDERQKLMIEIIKEIYGE